LATLRERYQQLFEFSLNAIALHEIVTDENNQPVDYEFLEANRAFEELTGLNAGKVIGKRVSKVLPGTETTPLIEIYSQVARSGEPTRFEQSSPQLGRDYEIVAFSPAKNRFVTIFNDITDRKRAEKALKEHSAWLEEIVQERTQELREAQEQLVRKEKLAVLGQLAAGVAHELRNPLGVISNAIYYLNSILLGADDTTKEYLGIIAKEVEHSEKIISDLLDYSREPVPLQKPTSLVQILNETLARHPAPEGVKIERLIPTDLPDVLVDERQIEQVLGNLLSNAYQAMPKGGVLEIRGDADEQKIQLSIQDTGTGISEQNMKKLFEPLFTTKPKGIGLGLAISKTLLEVNGGAIKVQSTENEGATFTLTFPIPNET
jgi:PAS domain S-box-containing protein